MKRMVPALCFAGLLYSAGWSEVLVYHEIRTGADGKLLPWYSSDAGKSYDHVVRLVWNFWKNMEPCPNGVKYYLQHQVWKPEHDPRGLGGDQINMALSSWNLLWGYTGDRAVLNDMILMADYWIDHGFSRPTCVWPNLPYPYNLEVHSGRYDGDMRAGKDVLQPDKAANFGGELLTLYRITGNLRYLEKAIEIADTLAAKVTPGDHNRSPWPFRVNAETGEIPTRASSAYTANWTGALILFDGLIELYRGDVASYQRARNTVAAWLKNYPMKTNKWGPFFEDITDWSDTETNADTLAWYILEHPQWDPNWKPDARAILDWSLATFGNNKWKQYGVTAINEQTAYKAPGNSHTARHYSAELLYAAKTGDTSLKADAIRALNWATYSVELLYAARTGNASRKADAIRALNWATYMVDDDGKNRYPNDDVWLTDGYGDYVRHYLRAMGEAPELAPADQNHLLKSTSVIRSISYARAAITYATFDHASREVLRIAFEPTTVTAGGAALKRLSTLADLQEGEGYTFEAAGDAQGVLRVRHDSGPVVAVLGKAVPPPSYRLTDRRVPKAEAAKGQAPRPEFPRVGLSGKRLKALVYLPGAQTGFYRGTRFDWSGMVAQVEFKGHTFFGELKLPHDPLVHDHTVGPCEEFGMFTPLGYADAGPGETFIKIGIGHLRKPANEKQYGFGKPYELVRPGVWGVEMGADRIRFRQTLGDPRGWGYEYQKDVVLLDDPPAMKLVHTLKNTGTKRIDTDHYNHSMYIIDGEPIGKNCRLLFPFTPTGEIRNKEQARLNGQSLVFLENEVARPFWMEVKGYGNTPRDNCVIVENTRSGVQLKMTVDQPLSKCCVYAEKTAVCPEPFVAVRLDPGQTFTWTTTLEFIVPGK